jgi:hypothetical protein
MRAPLRYHPESTPPEPTVPHAKPALPKAKMDDWEKQDIFRQMVVQLLRNGPLSQRRRRILVQFAAGLGLTATQAGRFIEEAHAIHAESNVTPSGTTLGPSLVASRSCKTAAPRDSQKRAAPRWLALIATMVGALLINAALLVLL